MNTMTAEALLAEPEAPLSLRGRAAASRRPLQGLRSSRAPVLIGFDAASVAEHFPGLDRVIVGRTGSDRPRGCRSEVGLRLDPHEWFIPRHDDAKMPAKFHLPRSPFRRCHGSSGSVAEYGFLPAELRAVAAFPEEFIQHLPPGRRPRIDGPMGPRYRGRLVQRLSDAPDPQDDLTLDPEDDPGDPHEPCATTSVWPEKAPRRPSAKGKPGTPVGPRLPGPPARALEASRRRPPP